MYNAGIAYFLTSDWFQDFFGQSLEAANRTMVLKDSFPFSAMLPGTGRLRLSLILILYCWSIREKKTPRDLTVYYVSPGRWSLPITWGENCIHVINISETMKAVCVYIYVFTGVYVYTYAHVSMQPCMWRPGFFLKCYLFIVWDTASHRPGAHRVG